MVKKRKLTVKQQIFKKEYIKSNGNATKAALIAYNPKNIHVAKSIGSENLSKPYLKQSIEEDLKEVGYTTAQSLNSLILIQENGRDAKATASDAIKATELLLKLEGKLVEKKQVSKVNVNIDTADKAKLLELRNKYNKLLDFED